VRNLVDEPNWEYATVERLNTDRITTLLLPFNLARAVLQRDPEHNLELLPGDVVTIFGSRDLRVPQARTSRLVRVEGEIERPGVYQLQPGDTLHALLARAGGVTPQAYLFGIEFSRESTRQKQRLALDDAVRRLEASLGSAGATQLANAGSGTDMAVVARLQAAEQQARQAQLARLRSLQPNGRIALELEPSIRRAAELPDIPLEDGDAVVIPVRPGFVFAVGAVANENGLLWRGGRSVKAYLAVAGVLPDADLDNLFVVRADGSVVHARERAQGFFGGSRIDSLTLAPGDTIVVPDKLDRESAWSAFVRGAKDWTQILSNFGLAAAAIKTLRN
jgi:protein involved in polysaccharide export with SLBB domain